MERRNHVYSEDATMKEKDTSWEKPKMIAMTRSNPEEVILTGCKGVGEGPDSSYSSCVGAEGDCLDFTVS